MEKVKIQKIVRSKFKDTTPLEGCAIILAMDDNSIKVNFLFQIPLTGHPIEQSDVDNVREAAKKAIIEEATIKGLIIEEEYS